MKVSELIEMLKSLDPNDAVEIFDPESQDWERVTGMTHGGRDHKVRLYSDEP